MAPSLLYAAGQVRGLFWNYFSVGLDAEAAYRFHALREKHPWAASGRLINQAWYSVYSCQTGWFCCAPPLNVQATLRVRPHQDDKCTCSTPHCL